jgi:hypothetical protein
MPRCNVNINDRLDTELAARGAATFGSVTRKQMRLNRFLNYEYEVEQERLALETARTLATLRNRTKRTLDDSDYYDGPARRTRARLSEPEPAPRPVVADGPATRTRSRFDYPAARTRSKCY